LGETFIENKNKSNMKRSA